MSNSRKWLRAAIPVLIFACSAPFIPWDILRVWLTPLPDTVQEQVSAATNHGLDGIIVYVDSGDGEPSLYAAGWKNRENRVPSDPKALFKIASISKLYMAVAAAKLVAAQRLAPDDTLANLLPDLAGRIEYADQITLAMLVQHRSGIPNYTDDPNYPWAHPPGVESTLAMALGKPADFTPGSKWDYSNTNYLLLGLIIDRTLGYSHHRYISEAILVPLQLEHTYHLLSEVNRSDVTSGYFVGWGPDVMVQDYTVPGGSMVATAEDVGVFLRALNDGSLLSDDEQAIYAELYEYGHTGELPGYQSIARYHPDIDTVVIQFVNTSGGHAWNIAEIIYNKIVKILREQHPA